MVRFDRVDPFVCNCLKVASRYIKSSVRATVSLNTVVVECTTYKMAGLVAFQRIL